MKMEKNKKGLSDVIATLMIILLVLVAAGILWVVVQNLVERSLERAELETKCLDIDFRDISVQQMPEGSGNYTITMSRTARGETLQGIRIALFNETASSRILDFREDFEAFDTKTFKINDTIEEYRKVINATKLEYVSYFEEGACPEQSYEIQ